MEKITDVKNPEFGKYYLVPCATTKDRFIYPIFPIKHKDPDFAPHAPLHYHHDSRFSARWPIGKAFFVGATNSYVEAKDVVSIEYRVRKLNNFDYGLDMPERYEPWRDWADSFIGESCEGMVCPHRKAIMVKSGDKYICPMHNLVGCPKTEKIVKSY